jgi:hypothetical protein
MRRCAYYLLLAFSCSAIANAGAEPDFPEANRSMETHKATGSFDVKMTPVGSPNAPISSMTFDKVFHGDLEATSIGQMLAVRNGTNGSAGYVAMERVTGTLAGRHGTFVLQHSGSMTRSSQALAVSVVPDSGTDGLAGLSGTMEIVVEGGKHDYAFRYTLPDSTTGHQ